MIVLKFDTQEQKVTRNSRQTLSKFPARTITSLQNGLAVDTYTAQFTQQVNVHRRLESPNLSVNKHGQENPQIYAIIKRKGGRTEALMEKITERINSYSIFPSKETR